MHLKDFFRNNKEKNSLETLHHDFKIISKDGWCCNRLYEEVADHDLIFKVRFAFDNPHLLNDCMFLAKIGLNTDPNINQQYIGFVYGKNKVKEQIISWTSRFPYSELITNLDSDLVATSSSEITILTREKILTDFQI